MLRNNGVSCMVKGTSLGQFGVPTYLAMKLSISLDLLPYSE